MKKSKLRVALLFGGRSSEHDVSLTSALGILQHINRQKYDIVPVKITREGQWFLISDIDALNSVSDLDQANGVPVVLGDPATQGFKILPSNEQKVNCSESRTVQIDVVFPILHGTYGEDGSVQGLLSLADLPFVGGGVIASGVGMDKIIMKQLFIQDDLPNADFIWFTRKAWQSSSDTIVQGVCDEIGFPCFVKPANTGSSVGICKVHSKEKLSSCISHAALFDRKILIEKCISGRELECSVLGNDEPEASVVGEIISGHEFYDYEAKYMDEGSRTVVPADISKDISERVRQMAIKAFKTIDCAGMGRVDFLWEQPSGSVYINEINTIPGFTPISMYPKLWEASGITYSELIDRLIELALERHQDIKQSKYQRE